MRDKLRAVGCADKDIDAERADCIGIGLRVAAADTDNRIRIQLVYPANGVARFFVGNGSDRARVDDIAVAGFVKFAERMAVLEQKLLHCLRFILVDLAAKRIKGKFHRKNHQKQRIGTKNV